MGASQSSNRAGGASTPGRDATKADYYELLGLEHKATDEEIKKAYRRKALELHPDRNLGNVENATVLFAEVQAAYEVLSDPQERAWYDSHRDTILSGDGDTTSSRPEGSIRLSSGADIVRLLGRLNGLVDFSDSPQGFFTSWREAFEIIAQEEQVACEWNGLDGVDYPSFGSSQDSYDGVVRHFYMAWAGFSTKKSFSWRDVYRYSEAPDRRVRRLMEKENRRLRDEAIREFNDTVRSLVAFVRKRDPRYIPNTQSEKERQQVLRDAAAAQAARSRAANQAKLDGHVQPEWQKGRENEDDGIFSDEEESEEEQYECVACRKSFKSEKQFETHEQSKKHVKAVQQLQRRMQKENEDMHLDELQDSGGPTPASVEEGQASESDSLTPSIDEHSEEDTDAADSKPHRANGHTDTVDAVESELTPETDDTDQDYAPRSEAEKRILGDKVADIPSAQAAGSDSPRLDPIPLADSISYLSLDQIHDATSSPKPGKAKQKRAKKAAQQNSAEASKSDFACVTCRASFPSKTKLFNHIKELDHAQPVPKSAKSAGKVKRR